MAFTLALPLALSLGAIVPGTVAANASPQNCGGWTSTTNPPTSIRVYRRQSGRVEVVPFRKYVVTVLGKEWPGYLPQAVVEAGAVAVKQYGWFHAMAGGRQRVTRDGRCYDVMDGTGDQLYKPNKARIRTDHYRAVDLTWNVSLRKGGNFFMTGYRRGNKHNCGTDATGWKLFARSATRCAEQRGYGWRQILREYYGPGLSFSGDGGVADETARPDPAADQPAAGSSSEAARVAPHRTTPRAVPDPAPVDLGIGGDNTGGLSTVDDSFGWVGPTPVIASETPVM